ncbi:MAG: hypothetical protein HC888_15460 [Candidatus Competibacteraceae bacterium]|nr:hypothetical protein [Candidatus Competibacteraceae bacterium]
MGNLRSSSATVPAATGGTTGGTGGSTGSTGGTGTGTTTGGTGGVTGGSSGGSSTGGTSGGTNAVTILGWEIAIKKPKAGKSVKFKAGKSGFGTLIGTVSDTGLDAKTKGVKVQFAITVPSTNASNVVAPSFTDADKVGKVSKKGSVKFSAKKIGASLELESGAKAKLLVRATEPDAEFTAKTTTTNSTDLEVK